jgi:hypothetical protein
MKRVVLASFLIGSGMLAGLSGAAQGEASGTPLAQSSVALDRMPEGLEIRFALSALPPHLRDAATVYVLDPAVGYVPARSGSNGFSCLVERTEWARAEFRNDIYTALCYDREGSRNHLRVYMDAAAMRAKGMSPQAVKEEISTRFANRTYVAPSRMGLSYMLAPLMRSYPNPDLKDNRVTTMSMPHHMIYAPNLTDADIGGAPPPSPYPFIFEQGPQGYMILLLGESEKARVLSDSKELLADLCAYRKVLCLSASRSPST